MLGDGLRLEDVRDQVSGLVEKDFTGPGNIGVAGPVLAFKFTGCSLWVKGDLREDLFFKQISIKIK